MTESGWAHLGIIALSVIPLVVIWLDLRHRSKAQHEENTRKMAEYHLENQRRLTALETMVQPLWNWWNKTNGH